MVGNNSTDSVFTLNGDIVEFNFVSGNWDTEITFKYMILVKHRPFATNDGNDGFLLTDTSNSVCQPQNVSVTFRVDMNNTVAPFTTPEINGDWNSYCGNCDVLSDPDGDNIWETTLTLLSGSYEYYFSADNLQIQKHLIRLKYALMEIQTLPED